MNYNGIKFIIIIIVYHSGDAFSGLANVINVEMEMSGQKGSDTSVKYEKLCKEHELLQQKLDNATKELNEKATIKPNDSNKHELQSRMFFVINNN